MAYPGEDYKMSNYGSKWYTPTQEKDQWTENVRSEKRVHDTHLATKKSIEEEERARQAATAAGSTLPVDSPTNYFNYKREHSGGFMYDRIFQVTEGYDQKAKRDDRAHFGHKMDMKAEEATKVVPTLSSSVYGNRQPLELPTRQHVRVEMMRHTFLRNGGTNIGETS